MKNYIVRVEFWNDEIVDEFNTYEEAEKAYDEYEKEYGYDSEISISFYEIDEHGNRFNALWD